MDLTHLAAIAAALGWASGLRLYAVVFLTGLSGFLESSGAGACCALAVLVSDAS